MLRLSSLYCTHEDWSTADNRTCSYCTVGSMCSLAKIKNSYACIQYTWVTAKNQ